MILANSKYLIVQFFMGRSLQSAVCILILIDTVFANITDNQLTPEERSFDNDGNFISNSNAIEKWIENHLFSYDPDTILTTPEIIRRAGYPAESYTVQTGDGYLLTMHRIPNDTGYPVFLQHGFLSSSADWTFTGKGRALAYLLSDAGFDVWLGNYRGNTYSRSHIYLTPEFHEFWDFSWHEMGIYDMPAMIQHVYNYRKLPLIYIGHSVGTTALFVMAANRPDMHDKIRLAICYAPVAIVTHWKSPVRFLAPFARTFEFLSVITGYKEILSRNPASNLVSRWLCSWLRIQQAVCETIIFSQVGPDYSELDLDIIPNLVAHFPAGSSSKALLHYLQVHNSGQFRAYDYGIRKNLEVYHTIQPPVYDASQMNVPMFFFYSLNDWLAPQQDVKSFYNELPNKYGIAEINYRSFSHEDFLWAHDANTIVYDQTIEIIKSAINGSKY
ncbi:lipase 3-like [Fopius arisanus]|uniref:Lipase 3-like n=1 Tax=Fopius arisanus TaxID=64838 RepID=A0A9R1STJ2_9HYME|nr:PREDICTED: lipase 3-like [Fopius arisanus]